jgi:hypothetical protein
LTGFVREGSVTHPVVPDDGIEPPVPKQAVYSRLPNRRVSGKSHIVRDTIPLLINRHTLEICFSVNRSATIRLLIEIFGDNLVVVLATIN